VIGLESGVALIKHSLADPVHEVTQLEKDEVDVSHVRAAQILIFPQESNERLDFFKQVHRNCYTVSLSVAWHSYGTLQVGDYLSDHLDFAHLSRRCSNKIWSVLVANKLHDRAWVG